MPAEGARERDRQAEDINIAKKAKGSVTRLYVTWVKSDIGYAREQKMTIRALGLRRLHQRVSHDDSPAIRGMLAKVRHLVEVEQAEE